MDNATAVRRKLNAITFVNNFDRQPVEAWLRPRLLRPSRTERGKEEGARDVNKAP